MLDLVPNRPLLPHRNQSIIPVVSRRQHPVRNLFWFPQLTLLDLQQFYLPWYPLVNQAYNHGLVHQSFQQFNQVFNRLPSQVVNPQLVQVCIRHHSHLCSPLRNLLVSRHHVPFHTLHLIRRINLQVIQVDDRLG